MNDLKVLNIERIKENAKKTNRSPCGSLKQSIVQARLKLRILERDYFKCRKCGRFDNLTIHHPEGRKFAKWNNQKKFQIDKCVVMCVNCHKEEHKK